MKSCRNEHLIPNFTKVKLAVKMDKKLSGKISKLILETQLQHKHDEKRKLLRENKDLLLKIKREVGYILRMTLFYVTGKTVQRKHKGISQRHKVKLTNLRLTQLNTIPLHRQQFIKSIIHNYSHYQLSDGEKLLYRLAWMKTFHFHLDRTK